MSKQDQVAENNVITVEKTVTEAQTKNNKADSSPAKEINGPKGLEPTRYGDWESKGRCYDF